MQELVFTRRTNAAGHRVRGSIALHAVFWTIGLVLGWTVALAFKPMPYSDFLVYWEAASDLSRYVKGGGFILILGAVKALGAPPYVTGAIINTIAWIGLGYGLWHPGRERIPLLQLAASFAMLGFVPWFANLFGIVNSDLPHVGVTVAGMRLVIEAVSLGRTRRLVPGVALTALGLSMRMQSVVALTISAVLGCIVFGAMRRKFSWRVVAVVVASIVSASFIELGMRARSTVADEIKLQSRITLYTGMFAASPGHSCGRWSRAAVGMAKQDLDKPLVDVVLERGRPIVGVLPSLVFCKLGHYAVFARVGSGWLSASIDRNERQASANALSVLALTELLAGCLVKLCMLVLIALGPYCAKQVGRSEQAMALGLPLAILAGYLVVHAFLEIQPRYILEPLAFVCAYQALTTGTRIPRLVPS